jgi:hypothetical protein
MMTYFPTDLQMDQIYVRLGLLDLFDRAPGPLFWPSGSLTNVSTKNCVVAMDAIGNCIAAFALHHGDD